MLRSLTLLIVLSPLSVAVSLGVYATLSAWRLDRGITLAKLGVQGSRDPMWWGESWSGEVAPMVGLPEMLITRLRFPSFWNLPALGEALAESA